MRKPPAKQEAKEPSVTMRNSEAKEPPADTPLAEPTQRPPPPGGFLKGALLGFVAVIPALAAAIYALSRFGIGDGASSYQRIVGFVAIFAGLPTVLSAGGVGRVAAHQGVRAAALAFAAAGAGLVLLGAIPLGGLPEDPLQWLWLCFAGAVMGAMLGAVIGLWTVAGADRGEDDKTAG